MKNNRVIKSYKMKDTIFETHNSKYKDHHQNLLSDPPSVSLDGSNDTNNDSTGSDTPSQEQNTPEMTLSLIDSLFCVDNGIRGGLEYFREEFLHPGRGKLTIVALAIAKSMDPLVISEDDAILHLMLTRQFLRSTHLERVYQVDIFARVNKRYQAEKDQLQQEMQRKIDLLSNQLVTLGHDPGEDASPLSEVRPKKSPRLVLTLALPTTPNDARRYIDGPNSVLAKTPCPIVYTLENGYAYVKVRLVVSFLLGMGLPTPFNTPSMDRDGPCSCYNKEAFKELLS